MPRSYHQADYAALQTVTINLDAEIPRQHLARFVVDAIGLQDLSALQATYGTRGGTAYHPRLLLSILVYGYLQGVCSSRKLEEATYLDLRVRYVAGNLHPDHDTLATFRKRYLPQVRASLVQVLRQAAGGGYVDLSALSLDGMKVHADASKRKAVSYGRLVELEQVLQAEVTRLLALAAAADAPDDDPPQAGPEGAAGGATAGPDEDPPPADGAPPVVPTSGAEEDAAPPAPAPSVRPADLDIGAEIARRQAALARLAAAKRVLLERSAVRDAAATAAHEALLAERVRKEAALGRKLGGKKPVAPTLGVQPTDQYNFTDPASRIMKHSATGSMEQSYNAQALVTQRGMLIVGLALTNQANDLQAAEAVLASLPADLGTVAAVAMDAGYFSVANLQACERRGIVPYIAPGREAHRRCLEDLLAPPVAEAEVAATEGGLRVQMARRLRTAAGAAIYRARKQTVEPVFGIIKEELRYRQCSLRGLAAVQGEWTLVCLAYNLKRLHVLLGGRLLSEAVRESATAVRLRPWWRPVRSAARGAPQRSHPSGCRLRAA